jgi:hypothetical protein
MKIQKIFVASLSLVTFFLSLHSIASDKKPWEVLYEVSSRGESIGNLKYRTDCPHKLTYVFDDNSEKSFNGVFSGNILNFDTKFSDPRPIVYFNDGDPTSIYFNLDPVTAKLITPAEIKIGLTIEKLLPDDFQSPVRVQLRRYCQIFLPTTCPCNLPPTY